MSDRTLCPVCSEHHFGEADFYEVCPVCGWEDDPLQRDEPDFEGGANELSLNQSKRVWFGKNDEIMRFMYECEQDNVIITFKDGKKIRGYIDVFEKRYDNGNGLASICFAGENGDMLIVYEDEIEHLELVKMYEIREDDFNENE